MRRGKEGRMKMGEKREEEEQGEGTEKGKMRRGKGEGYNQIIYLL